MAIGHGQLATYDTGYKGRARSSILGSSTDVIFLCIRDYSKFSTVWVTLWHIYISRGIFSEAII